MPTEFGSWPGLDFNNGIVIGGKDHDLVTQPVSLSTS